MKRLIHPGHASGLPYTIRCTNACDAACTDVHERRHRLDIAECCARAGKCVKAKGKNCQLIFDIWLLENLSWLECRAYKEGLACRQAMYDSLGCGTNECKVRDQSCCTVINDNMRNDKHKIFGFCGRLGQDSASKNKCPFDKNGKVIKW